MIHWIESLSFGCFKVVELFPEGPLAHREEVESISESDLAYLGSGLLDFLHTHSKNPNIKD